MSRLSGWRSATVVLATTVAMLAGGVMFTRGGTVQPAVPAGSAASSTALAAANTGDLSDAITSLQQRLRRLPADHSAWAALGTTYVQQAAVTGDPGLYPKAQGALDRSLEIRPEDNAQALTGLASLSAARHDFASARQQAEQARSLNPYGAANFGILSDALLQLGRYRQSFAALQQMLDLQPGVPSFTRASYAWELRGKLRPARRALQRALQLASRSSDRAYCYFYLGELAWNAGDLAAARAHYAKGLAADPNYLPLLAGQAKVAAATGKTRRALARYRELVQRLPVPTHLIAYADYLRSLGREQQAERQDAVVEASQQLFEAQGVNVDLELALFDADRGDAADAVSAAHRTWRAQPSIEAADAYAWALHAAGRDTTALTYARKAARLGTDSALLAYHRGMIEKSLGRDTEARNSLRRALQVNPYFSPLHSPRAHAALDALNRG
ncbi:MAG: tetratricopeptide repeat protein [Nocardioidaceae bacterium]|nr:tetratricopeptide repeat protein [Nocardioidaceae bacterium]MDQ3326295.1 tetratricopeptide repeat protein [Actinomycetota bacterium]